jgi:hypothetical protein
MRAFEDWLMMCAPHFIRPTAIPCAARCGAVTCLRLAPENPPEFPDARIEEVPAGDEELCRYVIES